MRTASRDGGGLRAAVANPPHSSQAETTTKRGLTGRRLEVGEPQRTPQISERSDPPLRLHFDRNRARAFHSTPEALRDLADSIHTTGNRDYRLSATTNAQLPNKPPLRQRREGNRDITHPNNIKLRFHTFRYFRGELLPAQYDSCVSVSSI